MACAPKIRLVKTAPCARFPLPSWRKILITQRGQGRTLDANELLVRPCVAGIAGVSEFVEGDGKFGAAQPKTFRTIFSKGTEGLAIREIDYGAGFPIRLTLVESAQMISPLKLKIRVRNADPNWGKANNVIHEAVMIKESNPQTNEILRTRVIESILSDGTVLAKDGVLMSLEKPSFWNYKCRSAMS
jgi:hypothetical protein